MFVYDKIDEIGIAGNQANVKQGIVVGVDVEITARMDG